MLKIALMKQCVGNIEKCVGLALREGFDMVVIPLKSSNLKDFTYPDLVLTPEQWNKNVIAVLSDNIACDSKDIKLRTDSESILREELKWAHHLQGDGVQMLRLHGNRNINLARILCDELVGCVLVEVPLCTPHAMHALFRDDWTGRADRFSQQDTWECWHKFHAAADFNENIQVVLTLEESQFPSSEVVRRWLGEPVDAIIIPKSMFKMNNDNEIFLPEMWLDVIKHFIHIKVGIIVSLYGEDENLSIYARYLKMIVNKVLTDHPHRGLNSILQKIRFFNSCEDIMCIPQQPLKDNLPCDIYEKYEEDKIKYKLYQDAIEAALIDRVPEADKDHKLSTIMIMGCGRGPLVRATLNAAEKSGRKVFIYIIEKNIHAIQTLNHIKSKLWANKDIEIVHMDMREYLTVEKADIFVSEMLGSFGDNELSPECLNKAQRLLKSDGISIPCEYTSFIYPVMSTAAYNQIRCFEKNKIGPCGQGSLYSEAAYVIMLQNVFNIGFPVPLFTFKHPNNDQSNERYEIRKFNVTLDCIVNGIGGCFESTLYKDIKISINPQTHTAGLTSWFGIYFPIKFPIPLKKGEEVEIHFWRRVSTTKVWYEWQIASPQITPIHNRRGYSYPIHLQ